MFKKAIMVIAIILVALSFACATSGTYNLRYIYYRYVEKKVLLFFTDMDREHVPSKALDLSLGLDASDAQVYLVCTTNEKSAYYINLTFNPMQRTDTVTNVINRVDYYYKARVWSFGENPSALGTVDVSSEQNRTVKFVGATVSNGSTVEDFYYPISFSFSDFIEDYAEGSFVATVIAEVTAR